MKKLFTLIILLAVSATVLARPVDRQWAQHWVESHFFTPAVCRLEHHNKQNRGGMKMENCEDSTSACDEQLSEREKEIVVCVAKGMANRITPQTATWAANSQMSFFSIFFISLAKIHKISTQRHRDTEFFAFSPQKSLYLCASVWFRFYC